MALVERWNGERWSIQRTASGDSATPHGALYGVSCSLPHACVAVGSSDNDPRFPGVPGPGQALVEGWNGRRWSIKPTHPAGFGAGGVLNGVTCASAASCTAVGSVGFIEAGNFPLVGRWSASGWSLAQAAVSGGPYGNCSMCTGASFELTGVSCASATTCTAVGSDRNGVLVERWDGTGWSIQDTPVPVGSLSGVSCVSANACVAVGGYTSPAGHQLALIERWDGTGWSTQSTPDLPRALTSTLTSVSCTSKTACTAVGRYAAAGGIDRALVERWNGARWSVQQTRDVGRSASLKGVSCPSRKACVAVGTINQRALIERWSSQT